MEAKKSSDFSLRPFPPASDKPRVTYAPEAHVRKGGARHAYDSYIVPIEKKGIKKSTNRNRRE